MCRSRLIGTSPAANIAARSDIAATRLWMRYAKKAGTSLARGCAGRGEANARETFDFVPIVADTLEEGDECPVLVRLDAGLPDERTLDEFDSLTIRYLARIRNNPALNRSGTASGQAGGPGACRSAHGPDEHEYQAGNWSGAWLVS